MCGSGRLCVLRTTRLFFYFFLLPSWPEIRGIKVVCIYTAHDSAPLPHIRTQKYSYRLPACIFGDSVLDACLREWRVKMPVNVSTLALCIGLVTVVILAIFLVAQRTEKKGLWRLSLEKWEQRSFVHFYLEKKYYHFNSLNWLFSGFPTHACPIGSSRGLPTAFVVGTQHWSLHPSNWK